MFCKTHTLRCIVAGTVTVAALGFAAPSVLAGTDLDGRAPDTRDAAVLAHSRQALPDLRSPDTRDAALQAHTSSLGASDGWYPYAVSVTAAARAGQIVDGRSPDTRDFAALAHGPVVTVVESPGFDWGDFGIGIAAALGAVLVVLGSIKLLSGRQSRKQAGPVATA